jgi:autotransporter-associated beta strand protein
MATVLVSGVGSHWTHSGGLYLSGTNFWSSSGTANVTVTNNGKITAAGPLKMWSDQSNLTVNGGEVSAGSLSGSAGMIRISDPVGRTALTFGSAASNTFSGSIEDAAGGPGSLRKIGTGTQTLNGTLTYTGTTRIEAGVLALPTANLGAGGDVIVDPSGQLHASGTLARRVVNNGDVQGPSGSEWLAFTGQVAGAGSLAGNVRVSGSYSPGNSPATVAVENLLLESTNHLTMEIGGRAAGSQYDQLVISGTLTAGGTLDVVLLDGFLPSQGDEFHLFDGAITGTFGKVNLPTFAGGQWDLRGLYTTGTIAVVPEPGVCVMLLGLLACGAFVYHRRRAAA